uniref:MARVEL domain-containing protein n=2 Tax=Romanomermis culicivorax TaxID=13658 RepID=A0A915J5D2_ROMCU
MGDYVQQQEEAKVTTTTTTTTSVGMTLEKPEINTEYLTQVPGILKIAAIVLSLITFICAVSGCSYHSNASWTAFVSCSAFVICIILLIFALLRVPQDYPRFNWNLYFFAFVCTALFGYETYLKFQNWRSTSIRGSSAGVLRSMPAATTPQAPNHPVP